MDPFRKEERVLTSKNSPVPRLAKQVYKIPKKTLQLEVKRVAGLLGHIPSREELIDNGNYPIEYYDSYFISWGEVTAAARTTGMTEHRIKVNQFIDIEQPRLLEKPIDGDGQVTKIEDSTKKGNYPVKKKIRRSQTNKKINHPGKIDRLAKNN